MLSSLNRLSFNINIQSQVSISSPPNHLLTSSLWLVKMTFVLIWRLVKSKVNYRLLSQPCLLSYMVHIWIPWSIRWFEYIRFNSFILFPNFKINKSSFHSMKTNKKNSSEHNICATEPNSNVVWHLSKQSSINKQSSCLTSRCNC